ncbi:hypothetical protein [Shewanella sp. YIC-542]|uniref:hypothetical protein n=1 Tax=Shewanella mytili TaxID=3377111 RepID=UPI00398E836D
MNKGSISFFEVKQCGFYSTKDHKSVYEEGTMEEIINSFCEWVKGRDFSQTIPWDSTAHPRRTQIYCKSIAQDAETKDTLLVLWRRFGDDSGKVSGIAPDAKVGLDTSDSIKIDPKVKGQSAFLGQPMYYWFIPRRNVIATVNFPHSSAMTKDVCDYIKRCLDYRISHPRKKINETESVNPNNGKAIIRKYITYMSEDNTRTMRSKFHVSIKELNTDKANAARLAKRISHIVVRDTISTQKSDNKDSLFNLWSKVKGKKTFSKHVEIIEEVTLSESEVSEIIKVHNKEYNPLDRWNNIGFRESGNDTTRWFNKYVSREHIKLEPLAENHTYYSADVVLKELINQRDELLIQIPNDVAKIEGDDIRDECDVGEEHVA